VTREQTGVAVATVAAIITAVCAVFIISRGAGAARQARRPRLSLHIDGAWLHNRQIRLEARYSSYSFVRVYI
jgi:hypothetical protein